MADDLLPIYIVLAIQALGMLVITAFYYYKRIALEEKRSKVLEQQRDNLQGYYDQRLSVEKAKLEVEKAKLAARNGVNR